MNDNVSLISMHPFFQRFIFSVLQTVKNQDFNVSDKIIIDADMVPRVSDKVMRASMGAGVVTSIAGEPKPVVPVTRSDMSELIAPLGVRNISNMRQSMEIKQPVPTKPILTPRMSPRRQEPRANIQRRQIMAVPAIVPRRTAPAMTTPIAATDGVIDKDNEYEKISPLLNDTSVSTIECSGEGKELMIIRAGQKQRTRIVLSGKEIKEILDKVADEAHIPLLEGVFRANIKGFSISAVISEMVGSRFVIKKATAYGLLE